jgi:hypothetical protein
VRIRGSNKKLHITTTFVGGYDNRILLNAPADAEALDPNAKNKVIFSKQGDNLTARDSTFDYYHTMGLTRLPRWCQSCIKYTVAFTLFGGKRAFFYIMRW